MNKILAEKMVSDSITSLAGSWEWCNLTFLFSKVQIVSGISVSLSLRMRQCRSSGSVNRNFLKIFIWMDRHWTRSVIPIVCLTYPYSISLSILYSYVHIIRFTYSFTFVFYASDNLHRISSSSIFINRKDAHTHTHRLSDTKHWLCHSLRES